MSGTNWWQYGKWVYNIGRTGRFLAYSDGERTAIVDFINSMLETRPSLEPRVQLKTYNADKAISEQVSDSLGGMLQVIGRSLRVTAASDTEKELCDALFAATADRKNRIATKMATLTVSASPEEYGTVTGGGEHPLNITITITAVPNRGYAFSSWSDDVDTASRDVKMSEDITLTAIFEAGTTRTVTASGDGGTVTIESSAGDDDIYDGDVLTLTAVPDEGNVFSHWGSDVTDTEAVKTVTVNGDAEYTAVFVEDTSDSSESASGQE